jgi:hypothetical protein
MQVLKINFQELFPLSALAIFIIFGAAAKPPRRKL